MADKRIVGFIGLGIMGSRMASRLCDAGFDLHIFNRTVTRAQALVEKRAVLAENPAVAATSADVLITMLTDGPAVRDAAMRSDGFLAATDPPSIWIDMSSIDAATTRELGSTAAARGMACLDAPVSGGPAGAESGTLSIMVGGDPETYEAALPLLQVLGKTITYMGPLGSGQITKACNQVVVAATMAGVAEALVLGAKAGVDPAKIREVLLGGLAQSRILDVHGARMIEGTFDAGFYARLHDKDLRIALDMARRFGAAAPVSALVSQMLNSLVARGDGELDNSAIVKLYEVAAALDAGRPLRSETSA